MPATSTRYRIGGTGPLRPRPSRRSRMPPRTEPADGLRYETVHGGALRPLLPALGELIFAVFRDWPYLYEDDPAAARRYLASYGDGGSPGAAVVVAFDGARPVGAATCQPMVEASPAVPDALTAHGLDPARFCYFGEAVLLPAYRGRGAGARFFADREAHARGLGLDFAAFCAVSRAPDDPRKPAGDRKSTRLNSSHANLSYAVFCLKKTQHPRR